MCVCMCVYMCVCACVCVERVCETEKARGKEGTCVCVCVFGAHTYVECDYKHTYRTRRPMSAVHTHIVYAKGH